MTIDIMFEDGRWQAAGLSALAGQAVGAALDHLGLGDRDVSLLACGDERIAVLNADFRGKPRPTNVLSWPGEEYGGRIPGALPPPPRDRELGDIAIAYDTCRREAADQGKEFSDHVVHLLVHGTLHLLGYDHIREKDAAMMEALEVEILGKLGISDPYDA